MANIKVAWICHLMNPDIDKHIEYTSSKSSIVISSIITALSRVLIVPIKNHALNLVAMLSPQRLRDMAQWNTNGIREFKKFKDIDLYIIAPLHYIQDSGLSYDEDGIHYRFFHNEEDGYFRTIWKTIKIKLFNKGLSYRTNRRRISAILNEINPDIVHIIGAECPEFSLSALDINERVPLIAQLQCLQRYSMRVSGQKRRAPLVEAETKVLKRADYFGTTVKIFIDIVQKEVNPKCKNLQLKLALSEDVDGSNCEEKRFDFVYFANSIDKAADLALEAFALCRKKHPHITLDIIGGSSQEFRKQLIMIIDNYKLADCVSYEGLLPTHDDVIKQIKFSRFALLPLKTDIVSGTIREAMAAGIPVLSTITSGTPSLNKQGLSVLLSPIGDHQALADNMSLVLENTDIVNQMLENSHRIASERASNFEIMSKWRDEYFRILHNYQ